MSETSFITPDLLCIGFFCHDLHQGELLLGGTAAFASLMASQLGRHTAVLTSVGDDFKYLDVFERQGVEVVIKPAPATTVFENIYQNDQRSQILSHRAVTLHLNDLPATWKKAPLVKFCLIADEADFSLLNAFPDAFIGATIQGWLRQWDERGKISPKNIDWKILEPIDIVFLSDADLTDTESILPEITKVVGMVVMTKGARGVSIFQHDQELFYPSFPVKEVDPTGAGDIFATAFLIHFHETKDVALAAAFAHAAASIVVEHPGTKVPGQEELRVRYEAYKQYFFG